MFLALALLTSNIASSLPFRTYQPRQLCCALQVRSDRNQYSKNLIESQDEIAEMKRKFKIMNHQIEQLKEEIQAKDQVR